MCRANLGIDKNFIKQTDKGGACAFGHMNKKQLLIINKRFLYGFNHDDILREQSLLRTGILYSFFRNGNERFDNYPV